MTTVERVVSVLVGSGYKELSKPLFVASLPFDFAAILVAQERALDLLVVVDMDTEKDERGLTQKVQSLARALDLMRSRRPLTVILTGSQPTQLTLNALGRVGRVLMVSVPAGPSPDQALRDALAVLLPLPELAEMSALADWRSELDAHLSVGEMEGLLNSVLPAADRGSEAVEQEFAARLRREITPALEEDQE
jgi:hypothetical protein